MITIAVVRNILVRVGADIRGYQNNMTQAQRSMGGFQAVMRTATSNTRLSMQTIAGSLTMGRLGFIALGAAAVASFAIVSKNAIKAAMDVVESESLFTVSMGSMAGAARAWSEDLQASLGLNAYEVRKNVGVFYNMTTSMGLTRDAAYKLSTELTELAYDMASFYNMPVDEMFTKLQSGITGETEPLKRIGILVLDNVIKQYAYAEGIANVGDELTEQQKVMARYIAIMAQTKNAQGDLARTIMSPTNQLRILKMQLQLASINLGNAFMPIVTVVLPILTSFAKSLVQVTNTFAQFMRALFGSNSAQTQNAQSAADAAAAQGKLGNATKAAGAAAKKGVAGFDEINQLQEDMAASAADAAEAMDGSPTTPTPDKPDTGTSIVPQGIIDMADKARKALEPLMAISFQPLVESFGRLKTALEPFTSTLFSGLEWLYSNILVPLATWTVEEAAPAFLDALAGAATILDPVIQAFKPTAEWLWTNFLQPIASWTGGTIVAILTDLGTALTKIGKWMTDNQSTVTNMTEFVIGFMAAWKGVELLAFIQMSGSVTEALKGITTAIKAATLAKIADKWETIALTAMYAKDLIVALTSSTLAFLKQTAQVWLMSASMAAATIAAGAHSIAMGIATAATWLFNAAIAVLTSPITLTIAALALLGIGIYNLITHWDEVKKVGAETWEKIKGAWEKASGWFNDSVITPIKNFFTGLWEDVTAGVKSGVNVVIGFINGLVKEINSISFDIPPLVVKGVTLFDGVHLRFPQIPEIPKLANGGIISSPTLAMVGEAGKEAVVPLENTSFVDTLAGAIGTAVLSAMQFAQPKQQTTESSNEIAVYMDTTKVARILIPAISKENLRTGNKMILQEV